MAQTRASIVAFLLLAGLAAPHAAAAGSSCPGDCDGDGRVTIHELVLMVHAILDHAAPHCGAAGDGALDVADVVQAVGFALDGCPPDVATSPTPRPTVDPEAVGGCFESAACTPCDAYPCAPFTASHAQCCAQTHSGAVFSWCPAEQFDAEHHRCTGACAPACAGLPTPTATTSPHPTPTSCRAVIPVVAPVTSPTDAFEQTIYLCGIGYASSRVNACGPAGCIEEYTQLSDGCPLQCPDSRQACVSGRIPLLPNQPNAIQVCQVPGIGCGPLPDLCAEEDVNGAPLIIEQQSPEPADCNCLQNGGRPGPGQCPCNVVQCYADCVDALCPDTPNCTITCSSLCSCNRAPAGCPTHEDPGATPTMPGN